VYVTVFGNQRPIQPIRVIVLAISVVVSPLATPNLIAHHKHGHTYRQHGSDEEVFHLPIAESFYFRIVCRPFESAVPTPVILVAVAVVLAILFVVLVIVCDNIVQREPIVARYEVDALLGFPPSHGVNAGTAEQAVSHAGN
jgi:hypothetical protein